MDAIVAAASFKISACALQKHDDVILAHVGSMLSGQIDLRPD